jgi:hypothetical protein
MWVPKELLDEINSPKILKEESSYKVVKLVLDIF